MKRMNQGRKRGSRGLRWGVKGGSIALLARRRRRLLVVVVVG